MSTLNHDTELEERVQLLKLDGIGLHNMAGSEAFVRDLAELVNTYLYKQTLELIGELPPESELGKYGGELKGIYIEGHRLRKAAAERWGQE